MAASTLNGDYDVMAVSLFMEVKLIIIRKHTICDRILDFVPEVCLVRRIECCLFEYYRPVSGYLLLHLLTQKATSH